MVIIPEQDEIYSIIELIEAFERLIQQPEPLDKAAIEQQKLAIIRVLETKLKKQLPRQYAGIIPQDMPAYLAMDELSREALYYFLLVFGLFENISGSYLFGSELISLIPGISHPALVIASLLFTILSSILFYAFEVNFLKDALGLPQSSTELTQRIELYATQLNITININQLMSTAHAQEMDADFFNQCVRLVQLFNCDLRKKHAAMDPYSVSLLKQIVKVGVLIFGAISSTASSYFFANSLLTMLAAPLVGTPVGWLFILLTISAGLGFYYAMEATSLVKLVNPDFDAYLRLKHGLTQFEEMYQDDLREVQSMKMRFFETKKTRETGTQTDETSFYGNQIG